MSKHFTHIEFMNSKSMDVENWLNFIFCENKKKKSEGMMIKKMPAFILLFVFFLESLGNISWYAFIHISFF